MFVLISVSVAVFHLACIQAEAEITIVWRDVGNRIFNTQPLEWAINFIYLFQLLSTHGIVLDGFEDMKTDQLTFLSSMYIIFSYGYTYTQMILMKENI